MPSRTPATHRIRELPAHETPRARLRYLGSSQLADAELLALLISADTFDLCYQLLAEFGGWRGLQRASCNELQCILGIGEARAAQIQAALEIARRLTLAAPDERIQITRPADAAQFLMVDLGALDHEELRVILLDTKNRIQKVETVYIGNVSPTLIRTSEVLKGAVRRNSPAIIIAHNHVHGDPTPTPDDVTFTRAIVQAGKLLDIDVLDSLVIGAGHFVSMRECNLGFGV